MKLEKKIAIITGAAKGMGREITLTFAREGADSVLAARDLRALRDVAAEVHEMNRRAEAIAVDVTDETQVKDMVDKAKGIFDGRIDILVNVAGVTGPIETPVQDIDVGDFDDVMATNVRGTFLPIKHVMPVMIAQASGKIINIGGTSGLRGYRFRASYSASKWAVRGLTRTVALEAGPHGINVNVICPGVVETPRLDRLCREKARLRGWNYDQVYQEYVEEMALRRMTVPQDIANAALFLASDDGRNITGQEIAVDGGWDV